MANKLIILAFMCVSVYTVLSAPAETSSSAATSADKSDPKFGFSDLGQKFVEGGKGIFAAGEFVAEKLLAGAERALPTAAQAADIVRGTNNAQNIKENLNKNKNKDKDDDDDDDDKDDKDDKDDDKDEK